MVAFKQVCETIIQGVEEKVTGDVEGDCDSRCNSTAEWLMEHRW